MNVVMTTRRQRILPATIACNDGSNDWWGLGDTNDSNSCNGENDDATDHRLLPTAKEPLAARKGVTCAVDGWLVALLRMARQRMSEGAGGDSRASDGSGSHGGSDCCRDKEPRPPFPNHIAVVIVAVDVVAVVIVAVVIVAIVRAPIGSPASCRRRQLLPSPPPPWRRSHPPVPSATAHSTPTPSLPVRRRLLRHRTASFSSRRAALAPRRSAPRRYNARSLPPPTAPIPSLPPYHRPHPFPSLPEPPPCFPFPPPDRPYPFPPPSHRPPVAHRVRHRLRRALREGKSRRSTRRRRRVIATRRYASLRSSSLLFIHSLLSRPTRCRPHRCHRHCRCCSNPLCCLSFLLVAVCCCCLLLLLGTVVLCYCCYCLFLFLVACCCLLLFVVFCCLCLLRDVAVCNSGVLLLLFVLLLFVAVAWCLFFRSRWFRSLFAVAVALLLLLLVLLLLLLLLLRLLLLLFGISAVVAVAASLVASTTPFAAVVRHCHPFPTPRRVVSPPIVEAASAAALPSTGYQSPQTSPPPLPVGVFPPFPSGSPPPSPTGGCGAR